MVCHWTVAVSFWIIFPILFKNLGFSLFFESENAEKKTIKDNEERTIKAFECIKTFNLTGSSSKAKGGEGTPIVDHSYKARNFAFHISSDKIQVARPKAAHARAQSFNTSDTSIRRDVCLLVVSAHRTESSHYLVQVVAKLLKELDKASAGEEFNYELLIHNGDHPHTKTKDASFIEKYLPLKTYHKYSDYEPYLRKKNRIMYLQ